MSASLENQTGAPLRLWQGVVTREWLDYNGHMTEHRYLQAFGETSDALYSAIGVDFERARDGAYYTAETHIRHRAEAKVGTPLFSETEILGYDEKRLHLHHSLYDVSGILLATGEHLSIHVRASSVTKASEATLLAIHRLFTLQKERPTPEGCGSVLRKQLLNHRAQ